MNYDVVKNNIMYHLVNEYGYKVVMSQDKKSLWLLNFDHPTFKALFMRFSDGQFYGDDVIVQVVSKLSNDLVNRVYKIILDDEFSTNSSHVEVIQINTNQLSINNSLFNDDFKGWNTWIHESESLTNQEIEKKMRITLKERIKAIQKANKPKMSLVLIGICIALFIACLVLTPILQSPSVAAISLGALYKPYVTRLGQFWRILTAGFLHVNIFHLFMNCMNLYYNGKILEPFFKEHKWNYILLILISIICGNLVALLDTGQNITLGISGGLFGLIGYYTMLCIENGFFKNKLILRNYMYMMLLNIYVSFLPNISWQAHLGGFIAGLCFGLWNTQYSKIKPILLHVKICIVILGVSLCAIVMKDRNNYVVNEAMDQAMIQAYDHSALEFLYEGLK